MGEMAEIHPLAILLVLGVSSFIGFVIAGLFGAGVTAVLGLSLLALTVKDAKQSDT